MVLHQAICRLVDMDNSSGNYFMVYELIEGPPPPTLHTVSLPFVKDESEL